MLGPKRYQGEEVYVKYQMKKAAGLQHHCVRSVMPWLREATKSSNEAFGDEVQPVGRQEQKEYLTC